ncbi:U-box domain-containing protein 52 [Senna tora]|uniref:RING-type E3 ubiquitin transferase n=1 Tax=Senna tora TaxID=362788 RepID=A0A834WBG9_9FABA|nr:U-box domain-containing protein 52 [Senna tora]
MGYSKKLPDRKDNGGGVNGTVAVAIEKDKGSQHAIKWAIDHLLTKGSTVLLIHVNVKGASHTPRSGTKNVSNDGSVACKDPDDQTKEIFLPYRIYCTRRDGNFFIRRFKVADIPGAVAKGAPDFCTVYVVSKEKIQSMRSASRPAPSISPLAYELNQANIKSDLLEPRMPPTNYDIGMSIPGISLNSETDEDSCFESLQYRRQSVDISSLPETLPVLTDSKILSSSTLNATDDLETEMRRLKLELKKTMEMYSSACKEALTAQQKTIELERWKREEERRLEEARLAEEAALAIAEREMAKSKAALEAAEAQKRIAELEAQKRVVAEMKALQESEEKRRALDALMNTDVRYRKYSIEEIEAATEFFADSRKIGEGGYGPVFKCHLDHTPVAVKVLRPDAAQGRSQFQQERKPEPLVHRDLKPANILLDSNYVSKISDVGLARLVPPSVNDSVTQYRMTSTAGTFCYIDPEYQQTGMLGVKSDIYSLGIIFLQILTAKPPMGLTHIVERAIEEGEFAQILDPTVPDWPVQEALSLASMALKCSELRRKDRPDLAKVVLPELDRLRALGERSNYLAALGSLMAPCNHTQISVLQREGVSRPFYPEENTINKSCPV